MNRQEKKRFVKELLKGVQNSVTGKISKMPEHWDGYELRWLIIDTVKDIEYRSAIHGRKLEYMNDRRELGI